MGVKLDDHAADAGAYVRPILAFLRARPGNVPAGPCRRSKGALLGRSHRSKPGKAKLKEAIDRTRVLLGVPADYRIAIVPASDTGAVEMALWSLLGARPVGCLRLGKFWRRMGNRRGRAAATDRLSHSRRQALRHAARSDSRTPQCRHRVYPERHHFGRGRFPTSTGFPRTVRGSRSTTPRARLSRSRSSGRSATS